ncbi:MAG: glycosyltransferase [Sedimentisphaerales bacterium]|nr:glycosyltransferase [Sedimentisphaerales bacterium]
MAPDHAKEKLPRVALIASERMVYEYSTLLPHLLKGLAEETIPVGLVCPPKRDCDSVVTTAAEIIGHPIFNIPLMGPVNTWLLTERLIRFKPTVLHCLCESQAQITRRLAHRLDIPYVLTVNSLQKRWSSLAISQTYCTKIIVPTPTVAENVNRMQSRFADRIEQINVGAVPMDTVTCFSEPSKTATLMTAHRFDHVDEYENLFSVIRHLLLDGYEFMMVVVGIGRDDSSLWRLLTALGLLHIVTLVPGGMPWRSLLAAGDIFIRPRPRYDFDPQLLEAMSAGAAVAACKGGVDDLIIEDQTAAVFNPDDETSILRTLRRLLDRRELTRQMAETAQNYVRHNHSMSKMISSMIQVYRTAHG